MNLARLLSETAAKVPGKPAVVFEGSPCTYGDFDREIVRYAGDRHINVVPEIEMTGHARAAISAYPRLGCRPETILRPWTHWGVCPDIFCPTDESRLPEGRARRGDGALPEPLHPHRRRRGDEGPVAREPASCRPGSASSA